MLFHAPEFLLLFLPVVLAGFALLEATGQRRWLVPWLTVASLVFYGRWRIEDLGLFVGMLAINWWLAGVIARSGSRAILLGAVAFDLAVLGWFKYLHFASEVLSSATGLDWTVKAVILPLGISFFTFQMIAHLVDAADGESHERSPVTYALFIAFFPQLIAGPIVHHKEMVPQFADPARFGFRVENLAVGLSILSVGLFKKVVLADGVAGYVNAGFADAAEGTALTLLEAWAVSVAFAFQIYFDFSGYSDMAVGLARMFGVRLPTNFASPYRAPSIIEFWARWHVTLTRFLTTYVYNPVAMALNRRRMERGLPRLTRGTPTPGAFLVLLALPTMLTMGLAGVWHGAGWQFVAFGLLHGTFLVTNHLWRALRPALRLTPQQGWGGGAWSKPLGVAVTFACVVVALVFFRAEGVDHALGIIGGMVGLNGIALPEQAGILARLVDLPDWLPVAHTEHLGGRLSLWLAVLAAIVWTMPNTQSWMVGAGYAIDRIGVVDDGRLVWRPTAAQGVAVGTLAAFALLHAFSAAPKAFLYFNF